MGAANQKRHGKLENSHSFSSISRESFYLTNLPNTHQLFLLVFKKGPRKPSFDRGWHLQKLNRPKGSDVADKRIHEKGLFEKGTFCPRAALVPPAPLLAGKKFSSNPKISPQVHCDPKISAHFILRNPYMNINIPKQCKRSRDCLQRTQTYQYNDVRCQ